MVYAPSIFCENMWVYRDSTAAATPITLMMDGVPWANQMYHNY
jgi:hypothetical protein